MRQVIIMLVGVFMLCSFGVAGASQVEVSGSISITGVSGQDGLIFPDQSKQTTAVNDTDWQRRVSTSCPNGQAIYEILSGGGVNCLLIGTGTVTSVTPGTGLTGDPITTSGSLSVDTNYVQRRVNSACTAGNAIRVVNADGSVTCEAFGTGSVTSVGSG